jgi:hypothetical protein
MVRGQDLLGRVRGQKGCAVGNWRFNVKREMLHNNAMHGNCASSRIFK